MRNREVDLRWIRCPTLAIVATRDAMSAAGGGRAARPRRLVDTKVLEVVGGHVAPSSAAAPRRRCTRAPQLARRATRATRSVRVEVVHRRELEARLAQAVDDARQRVQRPLLALVEQQHVSGADLVRGAA